MKESDIVFEADATFWVLRNKTSYDVMKNVGTHSVSDSSYHRDEDGLSIAIARCNYLAKKSK